MEARKLLVAAAALVGSVATSVHAAQVATDNFVVRAATPELARAIAAEAERYRRDLAIEWLGAELPRWSQPCPIVAQVADHIPASGRTSFSFLGSQVGSWDMEVSGSRERVLDSVLPHEVTHTIFATHFGRPLPRWADEGACTTVEHRSEKAKHQDLLVRFLKTNRGIAFARLFAMKEYPQDILPLYAHGYSLARFLIEERDRREFVRFIESGLATDDWRSAVAQHYGYPSLGELQDAWLEWVRTGSPPRTANHDPSIQLATAEQRVRESAAADGARIRGQSPDASFASASPNRSRRLSPLSGGGGAPVRRAANATRHEASGPVNDIFQDSYYFRRARGESVAAASPAKNVLREWSRDSGGAVESIARASAASRPVR